MEDEKDIFILQILVSSLTLLHQWREFQMPVIIVKIIDGPEVILPYRTSCLPIPLDQNVQNSGIFTFEKGKSCLFATNLNSQPTINLYLMVHNAVDGQQKAIGSSELYQQQFDPDSLTVQTLLMGKVLIYSKQNSIVGNVRLAISLQAIGSFRGGNKNKPESSSPNIPLRLDGNDPSYNNAASKLPYEEEEAAAKESYSAKDSSSTHNYSDSFCSSAADSNSATPSSDHESESLSDSPEVDKTKMDKTDKIIFNSNVVKRIKSNEKPKGWLRSSPVYKGNILIAPPPIATTRSTFLNLAKKYPYLESHVQNEVEKQLKEKLRILEQEYKEQRERTKQKSRKSVPHLRTPARALSRIPKQDKQTQSNISPRTEHFSKETAVGDSLVEKLYSSCDDDDILSNESDGVYLSAESRNSKSSSNKNESKKSEESCSKKYSESFATSTSKVDEIKSKEKNSHDSESLEKSSKREMGDTTVKDSHENERYANSEEEVEENISPRGSSRKSSADYQQQHNLLKTRIVSNSLNDPQTQSPQRERLQHQGSKTTTSLYPETTEEEIKRKKSKPSPRGIDDVDDSISNISAKIAAILVPRKMDAHLVHTDSISSYEPSDFDEDLSSITEDEIMRNIHFSN